MRDNNPLEEQYDKIYRYCYFKLHRREPAEDVTQETFLRFYEHYGHYGTAHTLPVLYKIARNLCVDEYRWPVPEYISEELPTDDSEYNILTKMCVRGLLEELSEEDREILLLRYVNEVPAGTICQLFHLSRFAVYRKLKSAVKRLQEAAGKGEPP